MMPDTTAVASRPPVFVVPTRGVAVLMVLPCSCRMLVGGPRKVLITCKKQTQRMSSMDECVAGISPTLQGGAIPAMYARMPLLSNDDEARVLPAQQLKQPLALSGPVRVTTQCLAVDTAGSLQ